MRRIDRGKKQNEKKAKEMEIDSVAHFVTGRQLSINHDDVFQ